MCSQELFGEAVQEQAAPVDTVKVEDPPAGGKLLKVGLKE
jgi:hypothetical protein